MPKTAQTAPAAEWLSVNDIATDLGLSAQTVYRMIRARELVAHRFGHTYRVARTDYEAYVQASRVAPDEAAG